MPNVRLLIALALALSCGAGCGKASTPACQPSCAGKTCGDDGCGGSCGECAGGCTPTTCAAQGKDCGSIPDLCGGNLSCGQCSTLETCGGGGVSNVCGCTPRSCAEQARNCGAISDGCGTLLDCGACPSGQSCGAGGQDNVCGTGACTGESDAAFCARLKKGCGVVSAVDNCGAPRQVDCGECSAPQSCGGGGKQNVCGGGSRGIWVWGQSIKGHEAAFLDWAHARRFTDVFLLIKGTSGLVSYTTLDAVLKARAQKGYSLRTWAWLVGFADRDHQGWTYLVKDRVSPADPSYRAYLASVVRQGIDPAKGNVSTPPDGVMLDDTFGWPGSSYGGSATERVQGVMAAVDAIKSQVDAVRASTGRSILLGFAPLPETGVVTSGPTSIVTTSANAYGQDFGEIGKRCDWIVPETYRYGFYQGTAATWIGTVVQAIRRELALECASRAGAISVYPALVLYQDDSDTTAIAASSLQEDVDEALSTAGGYSAFRFASGSTNPGTGSDGLDWPTPSQLAVIAP
jgi:hypothetical protein